MSSPKVLFGFHAVGVRVRTAPATILEIYVDPARKDARMRQFLAKVQEAGLRTVEADGLRLSFTLPAGSYATVLLAEVMKTNIAEEGDTPDDDGEGEQ